MQAIIFDLDGVIVSTNLIHKHSLVEAIWAEVSIDVSDDTIVSENNMQSSKTKIQRIQEKYKFDYKLCRSILELKDEIFQEKLKDLQVLPNVLECLDFIKRLDICTAIASNSRKTNINKVLRSCGLEKFFNVIVSADDVVNRKPAPDMLFEVYKRLGVNGSETIFIDDTDEGAQAGYNSLSTVIKINSPKDLTVDLIRKYI